ncbi:MAG: M81 family metallopeptidase [Proteobacteria bacterium]|nr:M81 family metallopeptidase [Pseudomonadota bacterium]MBI3497131.1 M81 family metallopeptidase [Pseudomonadota bacterium]
MHTILIAECAQEISSFNPVPSEYTNFTVVRGDEIIQRHRDQNTSIAGALGVFKERADDIRVVPTYAATAYSAGMLSKKGFAKLSDELLAAIRAKAKGAAALYFSLHGAMGADGELDPEGNLLERAREILGPRIPIVISLDLHGILTERMLRHIDGVVIYHTYPHVDFADTGQRAARLLLRILDRAIKPVISRVVVPCLVRGDELITETGVYGGVIRQAQKLEQSGKAAAAAFMIGNPFTDVPELCSQAVVVTDGDVAGAEAAATDLAWSFWADRPLMQTRLVAIQDAIAKAKTMTGPVIFTDAADATSSGATGDSNAILVALVKAGYAGKVLLPIVDPPAVKAAFAAGVGATLKVKLGGALDKRFKPVELEVTVDLLSRGRCVLERSGLPMDAGPTAVLLHKNFTIVAITRGAYLFDRAVFYAAGQDPKRFDLTVVKSPHCEHHMFDDWAERNFNIDAPGATSANLHSLGHRICRRPIYPLDPEATFKPKPQTFQRGRN